MVLTMDTHSNRWVYSPSPQRIGLAMAMAGSLVFAACSSNGDGETATSSEEPAPEDVASDQPSELILDYTLYIEGGIQVSGVAISPDEGTIALVTDFENVIVYDIDEAAVVSDFSVQLGDLPRQGSTEAITFTAADEVAVLYPDADLVRRYDLTGEMTGEVDLSGIGSELAEGMTATEDGSLLVATVEPTPAVVTVDANGVPRAPVGLELEQGVGEIVGLSLTGGDADAVYIGTEDGDVLQADLVTGEVDQLPEITEVGDLSDIAYFVNPDDEPVIAVTDDSNQYNDVEAPIRLYLVP
jgi:hypothetical protein